MPKQQRIRGLARQALQTGVMPRGVPEYASRGSGFGLPCAICREPITIDEVEYELQFRQPDARPGVSRFHLHARCFAAWEMERELWLRANPS